MSSANSRTSTFSFPSHSPSMKPPSHASYTIVFKNTLKTMAREYNPASHPDSLQTILNAFIPLLPSLLVCTPCTGTVLSSQTLLPPEPVSVASTASPYSVCQRLSRSINATNDAVPFSIAFSISCLKLNAGSIQLFFPLNPFWMYIML